MNKNKIIKYSLLFLFSFIFFTCFQLMFFGSRLDYFWNYNNPLQISNGLLPYKDINIITTPLFHFIISLFLTIFGKSIIVYAMVLSILDILYIFVCSKITYILIHKKDDDISIFTFSIYAMLLYNFYYEYNFLSCFFVLLIILLEIKKENKPVLIGVLASLSLLTKQSVGIFAVLFVLIKPFIFKEENKHLLYRIIGIIMPLFVFIIYLLISNTFNDFISYCIVGIKEFNNSLSLFEIMKINNTISYSIITVILYLISFITVLCVFIKSLDKKYPKENKIILYYVIICFACVYPIRDFHHVFPGFLAITPFIFNFIYKRIKNRIKKININYVLLFKRCFYLLIILIPLVTLNMYINMWCKNDNSEYIILKDKYSTINGIAVEKDLGNMMDEVIEYEKNMLTSGKKVIYLNRDAVLYHLSQNIYYKDYDLFMRGNFGENGENRLLNEIKESSNTIYIIDLFDYSTRNTKYNQIPLSIIEYVKDNFELIDKINRYSIYFKN